MTTSTDLTIATTILNQLGGTRRLSVMLGAKNFVGLDDGVTFKIGRSASGITHVTVRLNAADTYDVRFCRCWGTKVTEKGTHEGIFVSELGALVAGETGMHLSL